MRLIVLWLNTEGRMIVRAAFSRLASLFRPQFWGTILDTKVQSQDVGSKGEKPTRKNLPGQGAASMRRGKRESSSSEKRSAKRNSTKP